MAAANCTLMATVRKKVNDTVAPWNNITTGRYATSGHSTLLHRIISLRDTIRGNATSVDTAQELWRWLGSTKYYTYSIIMFSCVSKVLVLEASGREIILNAMTRPLEWEIMKYIVHCVPKCPFFFFFIDTIFFFFCSGCSPPCRSAHFHYCVHEIPHNYVTHDLLFRWPF